MGTSIQLDTGNGGAGGGGGGATNLGYTAQPANGIVTSSTGTSATIPVVDATNAGLMTPAQRAALLAAAGTNLSYTASPTDGIVVSDTGTDATVPLAAAGNAGLVTATERAAIGSLGATYQPLDADLTALAAIAGVQGDLIYHNGTSWVRLAAGTSGQVLQTAGAGANPSWAAAGGGGSSLPKLRTGQSYWANKLAKADGAWAPGNGQAFAIPWESWASQTAVALGCEILTTAGSAGSVIRFGIYSDNGSAFPGSLLIDAGTAVGTSIAQIAVTISQAISAGLYWLVLVSQGAPATDPKFRFPTLSGVGSSPWISGLNSPQWGNYAYQQAAVTGALPGTWSGTTIAQDCPIISIGF